MTRERSLSFIELHIEKVLLALAVALTVGVGAYYLRGPDRVEYKGQKFDPGELPQVILADALDLQRAVRSAQPDIPEVPTYARELRERFEAGFLGAPADAGPPVVADLRVTAPFGKPLPRYAGPQRARNIVVVTPLPPTTPVLRTGTSFVRRRPATLAGGTPTVVSGAESDEWASVDVSWVTGGAYFPVAVQRREMILRHYESYRAGVYLTGLDVQRQELLPSGGFSEWVDVIPSPATPQVSIPKPLFDEKSGALLNRDELDRTLDLLRASQRRLIQPDFYPVLAGDQWLPPPLPGQEFEVKKQDPVEVTEDERPTPLHARELRPPADDETEAQKRISARRQMLKALASAERAYRKKDYAGARRLAEAVLGNPYATAGFKSKAKRLRAKALKALEAQQDRSSGEFSVQAPGRKRPLLTNPEKDEEEREYAVWFHDDSVEPGKNYCYRMRVKLWNRYVGRRANLRDPQQAAQPVLVGEWSLPSDPISVAPRRHFFVRGQRFGEPAAIVEVFTWHKGNWLSENFTVHVGDVIGDIRKLKTGEDDDFKPIREHVDFSTGAIVLDLRLDDSVLYRQSGKKGEFSYRETRSLVLIYLDPADGQVKERIAAMDRSDRTYRKLKQESEEG